MRPLTLNIPKALAPVLGKPFVDWQLGRLAEQGVRRVIFCIGYRGDLLRAHVRDGSGHGIAVSWVDEGTRLLGTGGAIRLAFDQGALPEAFFVLYGDSYLPIDMRAVEKAWRISGMPASMSVFRNEDRWESSNAIYVDGRVLLYDKRRPPERRSEMRWIDYGLSILTREVVAARIQPGTVTDLADILRELSNSGQLGGFEATERFFEVGQPSGLRDLEAHLRRPAE